MKSIGSILLLLLCCRQLLAQEPPRPAIDLEAFAERLFPLQEEDMPYEELYETLLLFYTQPLDLNRASREELQSLHLLHQQQIESLISHRERTGPFLSLYELQAIPGWDLYTIRQLLPFVQVQDKGLHGNNRTLLNQLLNSGTRFAILRWEQIPEQQAGFLARADSLLPAFEGSRDKLYFRLRMSKTRSFSLGLTAEKDAGERLRLSTRQGQYGADFYSFHAMAWNLGPFRRIVIGDYQVQYGQGLVLGAGFYMGKGAETITTVARPSLGIRPYTSVIESGFFRGIAASLGTNRAEITLFASHLPRDGTLRAASDSLGREESQYFTALGTSGLHRTVSELANRHSIRETNLGSAGRWVLVPGKFSLGYSSLFTRFSQPQQQLFRRLPVSSKQVLIPI